MVNHPIIYFNGWAPFTAFSLAAFSSGLHCLWEVSSFAQLFSLITCSPIVLGITNGGSSSSNVQIPSVGPNTYCCSSDCLHQALVDCITSPLFRKVLHLHISDPTISCPNWFVLTIGRQSRRGSRKIVKILQTCTCLSLIAKARAYVNSFTTQV